MLMGRFLCQLCYTIVHYDEKHPCFFYKDHDTVCITPHLVKSEEMDTRHDETMEEHTGNSNDNYGNICQQNNNEESKETNYLLIEKNEQIPPMPARRRALFADTSNNATYDISRDTSLFRSIFSVREREVNSKENAAFQTLLESFQPDTISGSGFRRTYKRKTSTTGYIHEQNKYRSNVSTLCHAAFSEKWVTLSDERNWRSFTVGKECFSESQEDISQTLIRDTKNISEASTSLANSTFSLGNKELQKDLFEVSRDLTGRPISPEAAFNAPKRNRKMDAKVKQPLECMRDADAVAGPSKIQKHLLRPGEKRPHACDLCLKQFKFKSHLVRHYRTHTGNKPFVCDMCGKRFNRKEHLDTHFRIHTGEKPFVCDICGNSFAYQSAYARHVTTHQGRKPYKCGVCGKAFSRKYIRTRHYKNKHQ